MSAVVKMFAVLATHTLQTGRCRKTLSRTRDAGVTQIVGQNHDDVEWIFRGRDLSNWPADKMAIDDGPAAARDFMLGLLGFPRVLLRLSCRFKTTLALFVRSHDGLSPRLFLLTGERRIGVRFRGSDYRPDVEFAACQLVLRT